MSLLREPSNAKRRRASADFIGALSTFGGSLSESKRRWSCKQILAASYLAKESFWELPAQTLFLHVEPAASSSRWRKVTLNFD